MQGVISHDKDHENKRQRALSSDESISSFIELLKFKDSLEVMDESVEVTDTGIAMKAVKADDAEAEDKVWNELLFKRCLQIPYEHKKHSILLSTTNLANLLLILLYF